MTADMPGDAFSVPATTARPHSSPWIAARLAGFVLLIAVASVLASLHPVEVGLPLVALPLVLVAVIKRARGFDLAKGLTLVAGRVNLALMALGVLDVRIGLPIVLWTIRLNLLEAVIVDARKRRANAVSGAALIAATWMFQLEWAPPCALVRSPSMIAWCVAYAIWNVNFVCRNFRRPLAVLHSVTNLVPFVCCLWLRDVGFFLLARGMSLSMACVLHAGWQDGVGRFFDDDRFGRLEAPGASPGLQSFLCALCLALCLASCFGR